MITFIGCTKARPFLFHNENGFQIAEHRIEGRTPLNGELAIKCDISECRSIAILGLRMDEGGQRANHKGCAIFDSNGKLLKFKPLNPVTDEWESEFLERERVLLCKLYYPPFNFKRTGCKGCPYALDLQEQLTTMALYLPNERKQCEIIWKKVYDEYRRIGYRLVIDEQLKLF